MSPYVPLDWWFLIFFGFIFDDLHCFEEYWSYVLCNIHQFGLVWNFSCELGFYFYACCEMRSSFIFPVIDNEFFQFIEKFKLQCYLCQISNANVGVHLFLDFTFCFIGLFSISKTMLYCFNHYSFIIYLVEQIPNLWHICFRSSLSSCAHTHTHKRIQLLGKGIKIMNQYVHYWHLYSR